MRRLFSARLNLSHRLEPAAVFADEVDEAVYGFGVGDVEFYGCLADIEIHFAGGSDDIAEVGIRHFAGAVHDAAHGGDFHAFEVAGGGFEASCGFLEVEQSKGSALIFDI